MMIIKALIFCTLFTHDFHSSITTIEFNEKSKHMEITAKYFEDDFVKFVKSIIDDYEYKENYDENIESVLSKYFSISLNSKNIKIRFLGSKKKNDIISLFMESERVDGNGILKIRNSVLLKSFDDQVNITQLKKGTFRRTQTISQDEKSVKFKWPLKKQE